RAGGADAASNRPRLRRRSDELPTIERAREPTGPPATATRSWTRVPRGDLSRAWFGTGCRTAGNSQGGRRLRPTRCSLSAGATVIDAARRGCESLGESGKFATAAG